VPYNWWKFLHVAGVLSFVLFHGVSIVVALRLRKERDRARIAGHAPELRSVGEAPGYTASSRSQDSWHRYRKHFHTTISDSRRIYYPSIRANDIPLPVKRKGTTQRNPTGGDGLDG